MNVRYRQYIVLIVAALCLLGCQSLPETRIHIDRDLLKWQKHYPSRPIARPDRSTYYEGEDVRVETILPDTKDPDYSYPAVNIKALLRVFRGKVELTDELFHVPKSDVRPHDPLPMANLSPGDTNRWYVNQRLPLVAGEYWGFLDAGIPSNRFKFEIVRLPDSLADVWESFVRLGGLPEPTYVTPMTLRPGERTPDSRLDSMRSYAGRLLQLPIGAPLRMEGLRLCILHGGYYNAGVPEPEIVRQFVLEPRADVNDAVEPFAFVNLLVFHNDSLGAIKLAREWGGERLVKAMLRRPICFEFLRWKR